MAKNFIFILIFFTGGLFFGQGNSKISIYKGNQSFKNENFDDASSHYLKAIEKNNTDFRAYYNLGNTLYKKKMYADAVSQYQKALKNAQNKDEQKSALYNLGNAQFQNKDLKSAIDSYQKALKLDPNNADILKNLRIAKKQENQKKQPQSQNKDKEKDQNEDQNQQENNQEKEKQENKNKKPQPQNKKERSEEEENLLKQIEEREQHTARRALNNKGYTQPQSNKKDW